jgi:putative ABC transport system permease protein
MTMKALDLKLLRDLRHLWSQAITIALVVASGIGGFIASLSAVDSLIHAREQFYEQAHFAQVFADLTRAPAALAQTLLELPGVADVQTSIERHVRIDLAGRDDPITGRLIGLDARHPPRLNQVVVRSGRAPDPTRQPSSDAAIEALVSEGFAQAHGLQPGDEVGALINGRQRTLRLTGIAVSPEYVFAGLYGMPDPKGFGVFWIDHEVLAAAADMRGAFNHVAVRLAPQAREEAVIDALSRQLEPWGGRPPYGRTDQPSHHMLDMEVREMRLLGTVLPAIFAVVSAFLLNVVISRRVATQRELIAALKALGYDNRAIALHYLKLVALITALGLVIGLAAGNEFGRRFTQLYAEFFHFPVFEHRLAPWLVVLGVAVTLTTAIAGTLHAIWSTVRLPPAAAMQPPAPAHFEPTWIERLGLRLPSPAIGMILRNMGRRPWRTALSIAGVAAAIGIVVLGNFVRDAIESIEHSAFSLAMRGDLMVAMIEPTDDSARHDLARLPGVIAVESQRDLAVQFRNGPHVERGRLQSLVAEPELRRLIDVDGNEIAPPVDGLLMTDRLARKLGLVTGDLVQVELIEQPGRIRSVMLAGTVRDMMGLNAYMERRAINRLAGEGDVSSGYSLALERGAESTTLAAIRAAPRLAGAFSKATLRANMQAVSGRNIRIMSTVMTVFATVIAVGVVYNHLRIALAERAWELASLRVLGFTRGEVSALLLGETAIGLAVALPLGMLAGFGMVHGVAQMLATDQFLFPVVIRPRTYALAAASVMLAAAGSAAIVRRRIDRLDLVAVLKTRE